MTKNYYVNGNTVRELESPVRQNPRTRREIEEAKRRKNRRNAARRNRQRAMEMNRGYVVFLTVCVLITAATAGMFIKVQSQMTNRMRSVANLQSQVIDLQADNDARYKSLTSSVDMNEVKDIAMNKLGMSYPTEDQIVYYSIDNSNFMDQYSDIPK
jgi:cell division protein FtsL